MTGKQDERRRRRDRVLGRGGGAELGRLFDEVVALYLRLSATAAMMYRRRDLSGPRRTLVMALARSGPQTVAHLARSRAQARQRLQPLVNALVREGLCAVAPNPRHRQSPLVGLTARGQRVAARVAAREGWLRSQLRVKSGRRQLVGAVDVLKEVREALGTQMHELLRRQPRATKRS